MSQLSQAIVVVMVLAVSMTVLYARPRDRLASRFFQVPQDESVFYQRIHQQERNSMDALPDASNGYKSTIVTRQCFPLCLPNTDDYDDSKKMGKVE